MFFGPLGEDVAGYRCRVSASAGFFSGGVAFHDDGDGNLRPFDGSKRYKPSEIDGALRRAFLSSARFPPTRRPGIRMLRIVVNEVREVPEMVHSSMPSRSAE